MQRAALAALVVLVVGCAAPQAPATLGTAPSSNQPAQPKRLTAVILAELPSLISTFDRVLPGADTIQAIVAGGMAIVDDHSTPRPQIAEQIPSIGNGLWKISPDGHMETTWTIKRGAVWHDGTPFTTDDLLFTLQVAREHPSFTRAGYTSIDSYRALDDRTLVIDWKAPFIEADQVLSGQPGGRYNAPIPKHLLQSQYEENRANLLALPYWSDEFVGTGPFKLKQWVRGSFTVLTAFDQFALGRPRLDEMEIKFVPDVNAGIATILSGQAELVLGRGLDLDQAQNAVSHWPEGKMDTGFGTWLTIYPQFINPSPQLVLNLDFRRALMYALDRQQMVDTLVPGLSPIAHMYVGPNEPEYPTILPRAVIYDFDPRRAGQMIEGLGYTKGPDGFFRPESSGRPDASGRDSSGQTLTVELRTTQGTQLQEPLTLSTQVYWQQVGVRTDVVVVPPQRQTDLEYRTTRPAFEIVRSNNSLSGLAQLHGRTTALPENNYVGSNYSRYQNPEFNGLLDRYFATIEPAQRVQVLGDIVHHMTDQLTAMGLLYSGEFALIGNRLLNVRARQNGVSNQTWNCNEWDLRS